MSNKPTQRAVTARGSVPNLKRQASPRPGRRWSLALIGLAGLAVVALAFVLLRPHLFPNYWTADDLGPIRTNAGSPPGPGPEGMVWVPGGTFWMGSEEFADARPVHKVSVDGFWMDKTEVTNAQFAEFVKATGYVTVVERLPDPQKFPGFRAQMFGFQPEYLSSLGTDPGLGLAGLSWG